jgi:threonine/homoserine/homoserine lactone efflux protein/DNA-binding transcriptional ArsR family regulator
MAVMSYGLASLHKVLKDETRRKILLLLNEKGSLSYTDLMDTLGIVSTGLLNYHLKVLGELISKNEKGQYTLAEKGKLASRLLLEFPEDYQLQRKKWQRRFWTAVGVSQVIILVSVLTLHFLGCIDFAETVQSVIWAISAIAIAYFGYRMQRNMPEPGSSREKSRMRIGYTVGGAWLGLVISFFGTILLSALSVRLGGPNILRLVDNAFEIIAVLAVPTVFGGIAGYYLGKRQDFRKPKWMTWIDDRLGF